MIELDEDAFKVEEKFGNLRSDAAARMGKCRAVHEFVNTISGDSFSVKYTPKQLVLVLRESSKHPAVQLLFKARSRSNLFFLNTSWRCAIAQILKNWMKNYSHHHKNGNVLNRTSMDIDLFNKNLIEII
jgi:hypothetical protein